MNPFILIKTIQTIISQLPEGLKMAVDAEIDKLEDKYKQGSAKDMALEFAMKVVRSSTGFVDYPDEEENAKDETEST